MGDPRDQIIADLKSAIGPLIGEMTEQIAGLRRMVDETADPHIAAELAAEADRLGLLADAGARAVAAAKGRLPAGARPLPVLNDTVEVRP